MLAKRIIPCLDVLNGRVVKGVNFVNLRDAGDPVEQAQIYDREGADELVFLDITASHEARNTTLDMVRNRQVRAVSGERVPLNAQTVCLHGDGPHALAFAQRIRAALEAAGVELVAPGALQADEGA